MVKDGLLALLDSMRPDGGLSVEGGGETLFALFGGRAGAGKTRVHDSTLALQSWNLFPPAPIRVERICQEISRHGQAYNNVVGFTAAGGARGRVVVRGRFREDPANPQRFLVDFTRVERAPARGTSEPALRAAVGFDAGQPLHADMKPPRLSSDVIYLDDEMRINVGSVGGLYLLRRSTEAPESLPAG